MSPASSTPTIQPAESQSPPAVATATRGQVSATHAKWLRRAGIGGFLFFLIKGLLWLAIPAGIALWRTFAN
jgi:hypothetical protein